LVTVQGPCSLLDFVLISKAAGNSSKPTPDFELLSHHTCHCRQVIEHVV
jgi:hypothetical protein